MTVLEDLSTKRGVVIGVIHLLPLPGSARFEGQVEPIILRAEQEAAALASGGVDAIIIENFFDAPFCKDSVDTAAACVMTLAAKRVMSISGLPLGINVLRNDAKTALAVALACGASFIRVNVHVGAMLTDQGIIEGNAHELMLYRRLIGAGNIKVFADIMVKHAYPLAQNMDIGQVAKDTLLRGLADCLIVSGIATGAEPELAHLEAVRQVLGNAPILVGSGTTAANIERLGAVANGFIVATAFKRQGILENPVDVDRVRSLVNAAKCVKQEH